MKLALFLVIINIYIMSLKNDISSFFKVFRGLGTVKYMLIRFSIFLKGI